MSLQERAYSVLIVCTSEKFSSELTALISDSVYNPVQTVFSISAAKRMLAERSFDFIIINSPLADGTGVGFAIDSCNIEGTVVLILIRHDVYSEIYEKVSPHGVYTLSKPISKQTITAAFDWMISTRERLRKFEKKTLSIEEKMEEIRIVNRAKWLLINQLKMDEPQAHRYIEKQAMDNCVTKSQIAKEIIKTYS